MTRWHLTGLDEQPAGVGGQGALELPLLHPAPPLPLLHGVGTPLLEIEQVTSLLGLLLGTDMFNFFRQIERQQKRRERKKDK